MKMTGVVNAPGGVKNEGNFIYQKTMFKMQDRQAWWTLVCDLRKPEAQTAPGVKEGINGKN